MSTPKLNRATRTVLDWIETNPISGLSRQVPWILNQAYVAAPESEVSHLKSVKAFFVLQLGATVFAAIPPDMIQNLPGDFFAILSEIEWGAMADALIENWPYEKCRAYLDEYAYEDERNALEAPGFVAGFGEAMRKAVSA